MSTITSENLIAVTGAKAGQRAILKDGKALLIGLGGSSISSGSSSGSSGGSSSSGSSSGFSVYQVTSKGASLQGKQVTGYTSDGAVTLADETVTLSDYQFQNIQVGQSYIVNSDLKIIGFPCFKQPQIYQLKIQGSISSDGIYTRTQNKALGYQRVWVNTQLQRKIVYDSGLMFWMVADLAGNQIFPGGTAQNPQDTDYMDMTGQQWVNPTCSRVD